MVCGGLPARCGKLPHLPSADYGWTILPGYEGDWRLSNRAVPVGGSDSARNLFGDVPTGVPLCAGDGGDAAGGLVSECQLSPQLP